METRRYRCHRSTSSYKMAFLLQLASSFPCGAGAFVRRALLAMGLGVGQCMVSTVWYVLRCWCDTGAGGGWGPGCLSGAVGLL